jgi:hypothetical protein
LREQIRFACTHGGETFWACKTGHQEAKGSSSTRLRKGENQESGMGIDNHSQAGGVLGYCISFGDPNRQRTMITYAANEESAAEFFRKSNQDDRIHSVESLLSKAPAWKRQEPKRGET